MQCQEAIKATTALTNQSFTHALVRTALTTADNKSDPFAYNNTISRYTSDRFYGVMIDTVTDHVLFRHNISCLDNNIINA
jgi:hypothetical protein